LTLTVPAAKFTAAASMRGSRCRLISISSAQEAQVMPSTAALHSDRCAGSVDAFGEAARALQESALARGDIADHGIDHGQQARFGQGHGIEMNRHRADLRHALHMLHRAVLAQQDFEDVAALGLLLQRRRQQAQAARQAMDDAGVLHGVAGSPGFTGRRAGADRLAVAHQQEHQVEHREPGVGMLNRVLQPALADQLPMHLDQVEGDQVVEEVDHRLLGQGIRQHRLQAGLQAAGRGAGAAARSTRGAQHVQGVACAGGRLAQGLPCRHHRIRCRAAARDRCRGGFRRRHFTQAGAQCARDVGGGAQLVVEMNRQPTRGGIEPTR
jgi:hypothetical protein